MTRITGRLTALALVLCAPAAMATPLSTLSGGETLTTADVTFGGFSFADIGAGFGGLAIDPAAIDVTAFSTADAVGLDFTFDPSVDFGGADFFEFEGGFTATVDAGSTRMFQSAALTLDDASVSGDAFVEVNTVSSGFGELLSVSINETASTLSELTTFTLAGALDLDFDSEGQSFEQDATGSLRAFSITLGLNSDFIENGGGNGEPPVDVVPVPAALPLMLGGLGVSALILRRRRAA